MLFETLDRLRRHAVMAGIVLVFVGWILLVLPGELIPFIANVAAFGLSVYSLVKVFNFIASKKVLIDCIRLSLGLFAGIVGLMLFAFEGLFEELLAWLMFVVPVASGLYGVYYAAVYARGSQRPGWWILAILFSFLIAAGVFVFWNPWLHSPEGYLRVIGGALFYMALVLIISLFWIWPIPKEEEV
ncbi:MAG: hypothetical protein Q4B54_02670 [Coriobacteriales bacterium]|nr:hypothetical protein [Coriobacteriales bacterium]